MEEVFPYPITPYKKLIINSAITGMVHTKNDTPYLPISIEEVIEESIACCLAGASLIHIHAREETGEPSYKKEIYARIIEGIRKKCPDLIICVSTSGRIYNTFKKRSQCLELKGSVKPDMASLTMGSLNFPEQISINTIEMIENLAMKMKENNIVPEIEVFEPGMIQTAKVLIKKGILTPPFYFNILLGSLYSTPATLPDLVHMVQSLPQGAIWGATGIGRFQMIINFSAILMGGNVRVGLEDNIYYDIKKKNLATNLKLIERVVNFAKEIGREIANPLEAREIIGLLP
ncbi:MAG: 3-keto-5-aminohexanoate cleavage protein [Candidatus Omnitrophica bacterium]|nr:3-keto-5-aminohexanoate cleavage protein [Candidatus Omnitrophota bacterium]